VLSLESLMKLNVLLGSIAVKNTEYMTRLLFNPTVAEVAQFKSRLVKLISLVLSVFM